MRRLTLTRLGAAEQTAGMVSAASILARRVASPLLFLGAGRFSLWAALWFLSVSARADVLVWTNENGGAFSDNNNWSNANGLIGDHRVPGGGDTACIGAGASDGQNDGCGNGPILKGTITVDSGGVDHLFTNTVQLSLAGTLSANTASLGTAQISGNGTLSAGTLDSGFTMVSGGATLKSSGMATMSFFTVSGGGTANTNSTALDGGPILIDGGSWTTGMLTDPFSADVTVSGSGQLISSGADILQNSTFTIDGGGSLWSIAGSLTVANGQFTMRNGGRITSGDVLLGTAAASNAQVTIDGATSSWGFGGKLYLGYAGNSNAYMTLKNGAVLPLEHDTFIGEGGYGSLVINSGSQVQVSGGTGVNFGVGDLAGSQGGVIVNGQNSLLKLITAVVGASGSGGISVSGGGTLNSELMELGLAPGAGGSISISGGGSSWTNIDNTVIGRQGTGTFTVDSGGLFVASSAFGGASFILGQQNGSSGSAGVSDAGSLIDLRKVKFVMGSLPGSNGSISAQSQGVLALGPDTVIGDAGTGALYIYFGGQVTFTQTDAVNLTLGNTSGSSGTMVVNGSSFADSLPIIIGKAGAGSFSAMNHSTVQMLGFTAPFAAGGQATITVDQSDWVNTFNIYLGKLSASDPPSTLLVKNNGTMRVGQRMTIFRSGTATINTGGMMAVGSGAFGPPGSLRVSEGGMLSGYGRVQGQVIVGPGGEILPGNSPGVLTIEGSYEQDAGGGYSAEIGGTDAGGFDQISVTGAATLGGSLSVRLVNGFTPTVGQTFRIVNAASVSGAFGSISQPSQAGISLASDATGVTVTITSVVVGAPVISSATTANAPPGAPFSYQITATNSPTSFGATNLPTGLMVNNSTGLISGTPANAGAFIVPINANNAAGSGQADLTIVIDPIFGVSALPPSNLLNISTRMRVLTGDQVLIGGFIVTGTDPKKVIIRGMGPSLNVNGTPIPGRLADPTLELHQPDGTVITNDNWKINDQTGQSQEADIRATTIPPTSDLESALIATLPPGNYTAILAGKNGGTGVGLVEVYDLAQGANSKLANISTRGFVDTGDNVMIGGLIVGGTGGGAAKVIVRALGPSVPVAGALGDPTLELHDGSGTTIATNDNWKINDQTGQSQETDIRATTIPPPNDLESALIATLAPGNYTAIVRGKNNTTGVGLVEVYNLQ